VGPTVKTASLIDEKVNNFISWEIIEFRKSQTIVNKAINIRY